MPASARKLAICETPVDINEASAEELSDALPGIGDILAQRIVNHRDEHGPFATTEDLMLVPGLNGKRISKLAPRISMAPPESDFRFQAAPSSISPGDVIERKPSFSILLDPLPQQLTPSLSSLLPNGPRESMRASLRSSSIDELMRPSFRPSALDGSGTVGGSLRAGPRESLAPVLSRRPEEPSEALVDERDVISIPDRRPLWVALAVVAIGLFSATAGAIFGIRSQEGGPRARLEQRVGNTEVKVSDIAGSVQALEGQASSFASSINALDTRVSQQARQAQGHGRVDGAAEKAHPIGEATRDSEARASVRHRVRQAMRELDAIAPAPRVP